MNQILRFCVCRSVVRRNPFASKPISSSLISNNPTSLNLILILISKFHHTFNYPPQIFSTPGNQFRKFSGEPVGEDPATAECNSDDEISEEDYLKYELCSLPPLDASFRKEIALAKECVQEIVDFGRYAALGKYRGGRPNWKYFTKWYYDAGAASECSIDDDDLEDEISNKDDPKDEISNEDDLKDEIFELLLEIEDALDNIELRTLPPLDAVKIPADQLEALLKKWGLDNVKCGDYPPHLQSFGKEIEFLKVRVRETADFGKYAAAGKYSGRRPYWVDFKKCTRFQCLWMVLLQLLIDINYQGIISELGELLQ
ncbi:hypothetical protein MKW98_017335 [Papaver atlanticum]|uniref:Uncharacterized protein n=1 Tax=Papaver atlanticum TaxID=357466 RepID=A0AAD4STL9_9MAGN|nr:hypothetical protein MKW98_017335 [Papaver atlanticum]